MWTELSGGIPTNQLCLASAPQFKDYLGVGTGDTPWI